MADKIGRYANQLMRGLVEPLMLSVIGEWPSHGYRIAKEIELRSNGYLRLTASTVYTALRRLEEEGLVQSSWHAVAHSHRRCYWLTEKGRETLSVRLRELNQFLVAAEQVMAGG